MNVNSIKIGTRGSKLALYQAAQVKKSIELWHPEAVVEIKIIKTKGDEVLDVALSKIGDKGLFTKELETALQQGDVDIAVHSLKDLPTEVPDDFMVGAVLERGDCRDALVSKNHRKLNELSSSDKIATSSLRRKAGLLYLKNDFQIIDIRGNVNTRVKKMEEGYCEAIVMAAAGLKRLGLDNYITEIFEPDIMIPAVSQGVIALEIRKNDSYISNIANKVNHSQTWLAVTSERAFMKTLQGGCQIPVGCYTQMMNDNSISITGFVASLDGKTYLREQLTGTMDRAEELGQQLARILLDQGGDKILKDIRIDLNLNDDLSGN
jgi:hydroxymethylbilane synthase